jgi:hypothetical protein
MNTQNLTIILLFLICLTFCGAPKMDFHFSSNSLNNQIPPVVIPLNKLVMTAYPNNKKRSICIEEYKTQFEYQLSILSITEQNKLKLHTFPLDAYDGGCIEWLGNINSSQMWFLSKGSINTLDFEKQKMLLQYYGKLSRNDVTPTYYRAKIVNNERMLVIDLMTPSADSNGELNMLMYSLLLEDLKAKKTLKSVPITCPSMGETPPIFFAPDIIIYRNDREDSTELWKALDNTLTEVEHPLCKILNEHFKSSYVWELSISSANRHALLQCSDPETRAVSFWHLSWLDSLKITQVPSTVPYNLDETHFSISPSGKWVHYIGDPSIEATENKSHVLTYMDPALPDGFLPQFIVFTGKSQDCVTWMNDPEGLVIISEGVLFWWDLSKFDPKKVLESEE